MTNQLETAKEWLADLNKIIDKTDNECTREKRDVLEWLVEEVETLEQKIEEQTETIHNQKTTIRALKNEIGHYEHAIDVIREHIDDKEVIMQEIEDLRCDNE